MPIARSCYQRLTLPARPQGELKGLQADLVAAEQLAQLQTNRERRLAIEQHDRGEQLRQESQYFSLSLPNGDHQTIQPSNFEELE